jgi:hypothetical protein
MAFNYNGATFVSFATYSDVVQRDIRLFEDNEVLNDETSINELLAQASQRILTKLKHSDWWRSYSFERDPSLKGDIRQVPAINPDQIDGSEQEFKDLNIYLALAEYILPKVADFGNATSAEVEKIKFYKDATDTLIHELLEAGDWYDYDDDGTIQVGERQPSVIRLVRVR